MAPAISNTAPLPAVAPHLELRREIGRQGEWVVYDARRIDVDRPISLRVGPLRSCALGRDAAQLAGTIARLKKLSHPALATIEGAGVATDQAYVELEPFAGTPLSQFIASRRLSDVQRMEIALQVCEALSYLHEHGIGYSTALDGGVWVGRKLGSLRTIVKLVQWERVGKFSADGADQRAFANLLMMISADAGGPTVQSLTALADRCRDATGDSPKLKGVAGELLTLIKGMNDAVSKQTAVHAAEPLNVKPPQVSTRTKAAVNSRSEGGGNSGTWSGAGIAIAIIVGAIGALVRDQDKVGTTRPAYTSPPTPWTGNSSPPTNPNIVFRDGAIHYSAPAPPAVTPPSPLTPQHPSSVDGFPSSRPDHLGFPRPRHAPPSSMDHGFPRPRSGIPVDPYPSHSPPGRSSPMTPPTQGIPGGFQPPHFGR